MRPISIALMALLCAAPASAQADPNTAAASSRYTKLEHCKLDSAGDVDAGEDWVFQKCTGFRDIPVWLRYSDSARSYIGFGHKKNTSGPFGLDREASWLIEWRGSVRGGRFEPFAVIIRMTRPEAGVPADGKGLLFVFRLRPDGLSCLIASDLASNEAARKQADQSRAGYTCLFEPSV